MVRPLFCGFITYTISEDFMPGILQFLACHVKLFLEIVRGGHL